MQANAAGKQGWGEAGDGESLADEGLLERARRGDGSALATLAIRHWGTVHRIARNMLPADAAPVDVAEAVFLSVPRSADSFPAGARFRISLYRAALGECWRRLAPQRAPAELSGEEYLPRFGADGRLAFDGQDFSELDSAALAARFTAADLREGLQRLDHLDRAAFLMSEVEQLPTEDAAAILGILPGAVRARTHRATMILAGYLGRAPCRPLQLDGLWTL